jgi:chaperonin GroES
MASDDLSMISTSVLMDDLAKHRRYASTLRASMGTEAYDHRDMFLVAALCRRGIDPDKAAAGPVPVRPTLRLRPLADHVVVLPTEAEAVTEGGIIVPDTAKEKPMQGEVLAVGPGRIEPGIGTILPTVEKGQVVLFGRYAGTAVTLDGLACLILREEEILGILAPPVPA